MKPFTSRVRYAPEVASKPDRLVKDLANVKALATLLEEQAAKLRKTKISKPAQNGNASSAPVDGDAAGGEPTDVPMSELAEGDDEDPEPRERGSEAVERRVEKIMADLRDQGLVDASDERALEAKKVKVPASVTRCAADLSLLQTVVSLDLYLAYLRAAFHACYYCAIVTDHLEELQRKCVKHVRKPMSKLMLQEIKAAEAQKAEKDAKVEGDGEQDKPKEGATKEKVAENRDWKRNGIIINRHCYPLCTESSCVCQMSGGSSGSTRRLHYSSTVTV